MDANDVRKFQKALEEDHAKARHPHIKTALESLKGRFFEPNIDSYAITRKHVEEIHEAHDVVRQLQAEY